jgi:hypothetical protein
MKCACAFLWKRAIAGGSLECGEFVLGVLLSGVADLGALTRLKLDREYRGITLDAGLLSVYMTRFGICRTTDGYAGHGSLLRGIRRKVRRDSKPNFIRILLKVNSDRYENKYSSYPLGGRKLAK